MKNQIENGYPWHNPNFVKAIQKILNDPEFQARLKQANDFMDKMSKLLRAKK